MTATIIMSANVYVTRNGVPMTADAARPHRMSAAALIDYVTAATDAAADAARVANKRANAMPTDSAAVMAYSAKVARDAATAARDAATIMTAATAAKVQNRATLATAATDAADAADAAAAALDAVTAAPATVTDAAAYAVIADAARDRADAAADAATAADAAADAATAAAAARDAADETADAAAVAYADAAADAATAARDAADETADAAVTPRGRDRRSLRAVTADAAAAHAGMTAKQRAAHETAALFEMGIIDRDAAATAADAAAVEEFWFVLHAMGLDRMTDENATKSARRGRFYVELTRAGETLARFDIPASYTEFWGDRLFDVASPEMGGDIAYIPATDADVKRAACGRGLVYVARGIDAARTITYFKANKFGRAIPRKVRLQQYFNNTVKPRINGAIYAAVDNGVMRHGRNLVYSVNIRRDHEER